MTSRELLALLVVAVPALAATCTAAAPSRSVRAVAVVGALASAGAAGALAAVALVSPGSPLVESWVVVDAAAGLLVGVIGFVGLTAVLLSSSYLASSTSTLVRPGRQPRVFYALILLFWAILAAVPLVGNLGGAWLLLEATTAASALLVGFGGKPRALEAAWKYLILTSLGLGVALLGIVVLAAGSAHGGLDALSWRALGHVHSQHALIAYLLLLAGLAGKIGWAPVHNWLPDAHSEAPAPVSALLSAALLPAVLLVAWRSSQSLGPVIGETTAQSVLVGFGLLSLAVAVPFLWQPMPWKRLLAYSSLEHMGVIALGIGFGTRLALAGVAVHVVGHALAKALGFYAATPLLGHEPRAAGHAVRGVGRTQRAARLRDRDLARRPCGPATLALVRERGADRRRRLRCRTALDSGSRRRAARARVPRPRARAARDGRRQGAGTGAHRPGTARRRPADGRRGALPARPHRSGAVAARQRDRARARPGDPMTYRGRIAAALADGHRFAGLYAAHGSVRAVLAAPDGSLRVETVAVAEGRVPTIVDLSAAAGWDEREAADLYGVSFDGHEPLRPLVEHDLDLRRWTVPVHGDDAYQVAVGPIHAGVIESGHFRFHVVGDRILHVDARLFYKHRGLERAAEGRTLEEARAYAQRACGACAVSNSVAYAHACEETLGLEAGSELARVRTILLELERTWSHLNDIAAVCAGAGLAAGNTFFAALTERARRLNHLLTGHRFLFDTVQPGGSALAVDATTVRQGREELACIAGDSKTGWRELLFNGSFQDRLPDIGVVGAEEARSLGAVGPAARASGIAEDARSHSGRLAYAGFAPVAPHRVEGDVQARLEQRAVELLQTFDLLDDLLDRPIAPAAATPGSSRADVGHALVESPRGATLCTIEQSHGRIERFHLRTGSYANWPVVAYAATDNLLPDFPLINKSFELCYACADR